MNKVSEIMNHDPVYCTQDTRVSEIKYLLKKYNYDEILVVDTVEAKTPIGLVGLKDMDTDQAEFADIPSDVSALECMRKIPAVVLENSSLEETINIMRANHLERIPVVDFNGHMAGMLEKSQITQTIF